MNETQRETPARKALADVLGLAEGDSCSIEVTVTADDVDRFADVTGDRSPLHMDEAFARGRGFPGRVVHGALLAGYVSRVVGMEFPGENAVLQALDLRFAAPACVGDKVRVVLTVDQVSPAVNTAVFKVRIENAATDPASPQTAALLARGKVQVGFTSQR